MNFAKLKGYGRAKVWRTQKQDCGRIGWRRALAKKRLAAPYHRLVFLL